MCGNGGREAVYGHSLSRWYDGLYCRTTNFQPGIGLISGGNAGKEFLDRSSKLSGGFILYALLDYKVLV